MNTQEEIMSINGVVFDIQRFSLHDGPGIRTTVFLKGCPLKCVWCHNPESWALEPELLYREDKCVNCMACVKVCPKGAHKKPNEKHCFDRGLCTGCGKCIDVCIQNAIRLAGKRMNTDDVLKEVIKDLAYYSSSGGGLTISGGEPTFQFQFLLELLKKAKGQGLHTCMETSGAAPTWKYDQLMDYVDLFLYDIKEIQTSKHRQYTGTGNELIIKNLDFLCLSGKEIILRCPFIQGLNNGEEEIRGIAELSNKYPQIKCVEILPYHDFGRIKWKELNKTGAVGEIEKFSEAELEGIVKKFREAGCEKITYSS
jgi:glycyl-radical enzyme activating protein